MKLESNTIYCVIINQLRYFYILEIILFFLTFYIPVFKTITNVPSTLFSPGILGVIFMG